MRVANMPKEVFDIDEFVRISKRAEYCCVKRLKKAVKLKLISSKRLYTLKIDPINAEETIKKMKCKIREV